MAAGAHTVRAGNAALTLAAMTLANSMILVDQTAVPLASPDAIAGLGGQISQSQWILTVNILPLAGLMVLGGGGRLGDLLGLRRVFLVGAVIFGCATAVAGGAQDMLMMIAARAVQEAGAALMMPTAVAIVSAVYPEQRRGTALGILVGASAFFAALGPVLRGHPRQRGLAPGVLDQRAVGRDHTRAHPLRHPQPAPAAEQEADRLAS
jgi:MFS family permease